MRRIRTINSRKAPKGFDVIEPKLNEFTEKLRDIESESSDGKKKIRINLANFENSSSNISIYFSMF